MSCIFIPRDFDGPSFSSPAFSVDPFRPLPKDIILKKTACLATNCTNVLLQFKHLRAKLSDRLPRTSCNDFVSDNNSRIVPWQLYGHFQIATEYSYYRQDCRIAANCRYCFYSQAKNQVFRPAGATRSLHRFRSNFAVPTGTWVRLAVQNFTSISADGWECGPKISKNCTFC